MNRFRFVSLVLIVLCMNTASAWWWNNAKPKPGDEPTIVIEVVDTDLRSYHLEEDVTVKTDKGDVFFKKDSFYIVTNRFISEHTKNQDNLIKYLTKYKSNKKMMGYYQIASIVLLIITILLIIYNKVLLKIRKR